MTEQTPTGEPRPDVDQMPLSTLVSEVTGDLSKLMHQELELAKTEMREEAVRTGKAAGLLGVSGVGANLLLVFLSLAVMFGLDAVMPIGWAALIVAAVWAVVAGVTFAVGRDRLRRVRPVPEQTVETVKEDVRWARARTS
jgi:uncharacterized membrane protein YqjE